MKNIKIAVLLRSNDSSLYINTSYIKYFNSLGFSINFIDLNSNLKPYDVFILPGGYDVNPKYYHEPNIHSSNISEYNDSFDFKVIAYALMTNKKVFGICRGIQSINVFFNGILSQHIDGHLKENHFIKMNSKYILTNSRHHQCIRQIGDQLECVAKSLDGTIEMIQHQNKKIIGVQFHPELMNSPIISKIILKFFIEV